MTETQTSSDAAQPILPVAVSRKPILAGLLAVALLAAGAGIGAGAAGFAHRPQMFFDPALTETKIAELSQDETVAVGGRVAEIFGNKFILQDATGRALVETGREGEGGGLVKPEEALTVQGRFERGFLHASAIRHADGRIQVLGPPHPPRPHDRFRAADVRPVPVQPMHGPAGS